MEDPQNSLRPEVLLFDFSLNEIEAPNIFFINRGDDLVIGIFCKYNWAFESMFCASKL